MSLHSSRTGFLTRLTGLGLLFAPGICLAIAAASTSSTGFLIGAIVLGVVSLFFLRKHPVWRPPVGMPLAIMLFAAAAWLWTDPKGSHDNFSRFARGTLLITGAIVFGVNELFRTGVEPRRRANGVVRKVLERQQWPLTLLDCRDISEVEILRSALQEDLSPVVRLMADPRPEVRAAGFAAVEGRRYWRLNEAQLMLEAAKHTIEPGVRAVASLALGGVKHPEIYTEIAHFLRDPSEEVRAACLAGMLSDGGRRWPLIRDKIKETLLDPKLASDGSLPGAAGMYPVMAVVDFTAWATEGGLVAERSVRTLISHYNYQLKSEMRADVAYELTRQLLDVKVGTDLRVGFAKLLSKHKLLTHQILDRMTSAEQPGPVRLMAAELILADNPDNADGLDVLRGLGRQQNREISLAIARILQTHLSMNFGMPAVAPAVQSKQAGEITKRVVMWASGKQIEQAVFQSEHPTPTSPFGSMPTARSRSRRDSEDEVEFGGGTVSGPQSIIR